MEVRPGHPSRNLRILLIGRVLRAFGFGFATVLLAIDLQGRGLSSTEIGVVLAVGLAAASLTGLLTVMVASRLSRRATLAAIGALMSLCGLDLALAGPFWLLVLSGLTGMMGAASVDLGPFLAIEQAILTRAVPPTTRNRAFARYSLAGALAGAAGGFAAGLGTTPLRVQGFFILFALLGLITALTPLLLSDEVEHEAQGPIFGSFRPVMGLSALFSLDSLGNGLVVNSVLAYWLHIRFGATPAVLGPSFAVMSLLGALSLEMSGRLADRIGLVNTMVFTHLPSNVLVMLVPFAPGLGWALALLFLRATVVQMDQPARQAYVVSIVRPSERGGALALTGAVRGVAQSFGPAVTGVAIHAAALGLPFLLGGGLKLSYDLALYCGFRQRKGDHEAVGLGR
ncbi:MAG TPA: MFS transporter [Solirubrobacteraceae bacterium]|nr:MFS transporter [Solirubrobacteraceae bacterium]